MHIVQVNFYTGLMVKIKRVDQRLLFPLHSLTFMYPHYTTQHYQQKRSHSPDIINMLSGSSKNNASSSSSNNIDSESNAGDLDGDGEAVTPGTFFVLFS